jgi:hypothetical protein
MDLALSLYQPAVPPTFDLAINLDPESAAEVSECLRACEQLPAVKDDQSLAGCVEVAGNVKSLLNGIEQSREQLKRPFLKACRIIDDAAKRSKKRLEDAYANVTSAIAIYESGRRLAREEEKRLLDIKTKELAREAFNEKDVEKRDQIMEQARAAAIEAQRTVEPVSGMRLAKKFTFKLIDADAVWKTNRHFLRVEIDHAAVMDAIRSMEERGEPLSLPGIEITKIMQASVSGK